MPGAGAEAGLSREAVTLTKVDEVARRVEIDPNITTDLPRVLCDRVQLQQVLLNLLLNGMDAPADSPAADKWRRPFKFRGKIGTVKVQLKQRDSSSSPSLDHPDSMNHLPL